MQKIKWFFFVFCFILTSFPVAASQTFVVTADVVFAREKPGEASPLENMTVEQLREEYWRSNYGFPSYHFYGENIIGEIDKSKPTVVREVFEAQTKHPKEKYSSYFDLKKLWPEPPLSPPSLEKQMATKNTEVYLLPDTKSRKVLALYQGEVVPIVGTLTVGGTSWSKARFCSDTDFDYYEAKYEDLKGHERKCTRYGYIRSDALLALLPGSIDESTLTLAEIPRKMRNDGLKLTEAERKKLTQNGFYIEEIAPNNKTSYGELMVDDMVDRYRGIPRLRSSPAFITSDLYLHTFHLIFDRMLQDIEEEKLYPEIKALTIQMTDNARKELISYSGKEVYIQKALLNNLFFFSVAAKLIDPTFEVPSMVKSDALRVVDRIVKAEGKLPSLSREIELGDEDFTQYRLRGHYQSKYHIRSHDGHSGSESDALERYFRTMMWYGRHTFLLSDDAKTLSAVLISRNLESSGQMKQWKNINAALTRLVGKIDQWSPEDYGSVSLQVFGTRNPRLEDISKDKLTAFKEIALKKLPVHRIVSVQTGLNYSQQERLEMTAGFKFLGQRFTPDAYIFNQLTSPSVGTDLDPRNLPTALDVMGILGSSAADTLLAEQMRGHDWAETYKTQVVKLKNEIVEEMGKGETSYSDWLRVLSSLLTDTKSRQFFTLSEPWRYKVMNTALSSWTELKHDTVLYAEQSASEQGSGDEFSVPPYEPPYVKGYVEPSPVFFGALLKMATTLRTELLGYRLLTAEYDDKLQTFAYHVQKAYDIAQKEVSDGTLTRDDYRWIEIMINSFDRRLVLPYGADEIPPDMLRMALISDVALDAVSGKVLETAIGVPQRIIVAVKDLSGGTRICTGYVYSWYEFAGDKRWTDEEWKNLVYGNDRKRLRTLKPSWYSKLLK